MLRFREIYEIWRRDSSLRLALTESHEMLDKTHQMFCESVALLRDEETSQMSLDVYAEDRRINAYQIQVRKRVLQHLAVAGMVDLIPGLVLTCIVTDIERIGDYTKNIAELAMAYPGKLEGARFERGIAEIEQTVETLFGGARQILESSDHRAACSLIDECYRIRADADRIINELVQGDDESLGGAQMAVIALYVRYLKRVGAHLLNILSSVANPFERIGYRADSSHRS